MTNDVTKAAAAARLRPESMLHQGAWQWLSFCAPTDSIEGCFEDKWIRGVDRRRGWDRLPQIVEETTMTVSDRVIVPGPGVNIT